MQVATDLDPRIAAALDQALQPPPHGPPRGCSLCTRRRVCTRAPSFFTADTLRRCRTPRPTEVDHTYGFPMPVGHGGLWHVAPGVSDGTPGGALTGGILSHTGAGGTVAWAGPASRLAVAVLHNRMFFGPQPVAPFGGIGDAVRAVAAEHR